MLQVPIRQRRTKFNSKVSVNIPSPLPESIKVAACTFSLTHRSQGDFYWRHLKRHYKAPLAMKWVFPYFSKKNRNSDSSFFTIIRVMVKEKKQKTKLVLRLILVPTAPWKIKPAILSKSRGANTNPNGGLFNLFSFLGKKAVKKVRSYWSKNKHTNSTFLHLLSVNKGDSSYPKLLETGFGWKIIPMGWTQFHKLPGGGELLRH